MIFVQGDENNIIHNRLSDAPVDILKVTGSIENKFEANLFDNVIVQIKDPLATTLQDLSCPNDDCSDPSCVTVNGRAKGRK